MKKNLINTLFVFILIISFVMSAVSCAQNGPQDDTTGQGQTEATENTEATQPLLGGSTLLGGIPSNDGCTYYIKLDGIEGDSKDSEHVKWIGVTDFSHVVSRDSQTDVTYPIVFTHVVDTATPAIERKCASGYVFRNVTFHAAKSIAGRQTLIYEVVFSQVRIVNTAVRSVTDEDGSSHLIEEVTMLAESETCVYDNADDNSDYGKTTVGNGLRYYLNLNGIDGESNSSEYRRWIDVTGFSHGTVYGDYVGSFEPVVFTHRVDKSTPTIRQYCLNGSRLSTGKFVATASIAGKQTPVYNTNLDGIRILRSVVKTVTDENGVSYLVEEVSMYVEKETWIAIKPGLDDSNSGRTEESFDQNRRV